MIALLYRDPQSRALQIVALASRIFEVPQHWIVGNDRRTKTFRARAAAMAVSRQVIRLSYPALGRIFGNRDHSTVMYAVRQIKVLQLRSPRFDRRYRKLELAARTLMEGPGLPGPAGGGDDVFLDLVLAARRAGQLDAGRTRQLLGELLAG